MNIKAAINRGLLKCRKHSPEILLVTGIVGVVGAGVMACRATLKVNEIIDEHNENMEKIRSVGAEEREDYTLQDVKRDTTIQYINTTKDLLKLYGPSILVAGTSIAAILVGNNILRKRCVALAAAYTSVDTAFKAYRQRVIDKYGEEEDHKLYFGTEEIEETITGEDGKKQKIKKTISDRNAYVKYFTPANKYWENDDDYIKCVFDMKKKYLNKLFRQKGFLTLNEAYRELGLEETNDGMVHGWVYDKDNPVGDNYIQFYDHKTTIPMDDGETEMEVYELEFNCDGFIYDKI